MGFPSVGMPHPAVECPEPAPLTNGNVTGGERGEGAKITYSCSKGFVLNGPSIRTCTQNGTWLGAAPTCDGTMY